MSFIWELLTQTDDVLNELVANHLTLSYLFLFSLVFAETGLIITPFLPGDGLLFSAGVVASASQLDVRLLIVLLFIAAVLGNLTNYAIGRFLGQKIQLVSHPWLKKRLNEYMHSAEVFYERYGKMAIVAGRFFPIIRTYVPFFAGVAQMPFRNFALMSLLGAGIWVPLFLLTGYFLGGFPWVKENYGAIFVGIVLVSLIPIFVATFRKYAKKQA